MKTGHRARQSRVKQGKAGQDMGFGKGSRPQGRVQGRAGQGRAGQGRARAKQSMIRQC